MSAPRQPPSPRKSPLLPPSGTPSPGTVAAAAALRRQHKMTLERKVSEHAVSDTPLSSATASPGPNSDEYFGPSSAASSSLAAPSVTAITSNIATTAERRGAGAPGSVPVRGGLLGGRPPAAAPARLQPLDFGAEEGMRRERRESVGRGQGGKKSLKGAFDHGRGRGEVSLDGEEAEVERKKQQEAMEKLRG